MPKNTLKVRSGGAKGVDTAFEEGAGDKSSEYNQKQVWKLDRFEADGGIEFEYKFCGGDE